MPNLIRGLAFLRVLKASSPSSLGGPKARSEEGVSLGSSIHGVDVYAILSWVSRPVHIKMSV